MSGRPLRAALAEYLGCAVPLGSSWLVTDCCWSSSLASASRRALAG